MAGVGSYSAICLSSLDYLRGLQCYLRFLNLGELLMLLLSYWGSLQAYLIINILVKSFPGTMGIFIVNLTEPLVIMSGAPAFLMVLVPESCGCTLESSHSLFGITDLSGVLGLLLISLY